MCNFLLLNEVKARQFCSFPQCLQFSGLIFLLAFVRALADISFAVFEQTVNRSRQFVGPGGDPFGGPKLGLHPAIESPHGALTSLQSGRPDPQRVGQVCPPSKICRELGNEKLPYPHSIVFNVGVRNYDHETMKNQLQSLFIGLELLAGVHQATAQVTNLGITPAPGGQSVLYWSVSTTNYVLQTVTNLTSTNG